MTKLTKSDIVVRIKAIMVSVDRLGAGEGNRVKILLDFVQARLEELADEIEEEIHA